MIDEIIIHMGMHKTGSSSIQDTFSKISMANVEYLSLGTANHSGFFSTVLLKEPENYHTHRRNGLNKKQVRELQQSYLEKLHKVLEGVRKSKALISAEDLSSSSNQYSEIEYLKKLLSPYCRRIRIIGYVRPPASYMQSAFQQRMKGGGQNVFDLEKVYPYYQLSFEKMDAIFGKENVELIAFNRDSLHNGDVVQDFARRIGVTIDARQIVRTNESLSLEATALLFAFRCFGGKPKGYKGYNRDNNLLIAKLNEVGNQKLLFSELALAPVFEANHQDIEWISQRLGSSILEEPSITHQAIDCEKSLLSSAYVSRLAIWHLLEQVAPLRKDITGLAQLIDQLRTLHAQDISPLELAENTLFTPEKLTNIKSSKSEPVTLLNLLADALEKNGHQSAARGVRGASQRAFHLINRGSNK
ncbi:MULTISPECIES: hypothetical protein [Halomonadaceae]|uniref:Sulfotransferase domain-containing protein n=1 Tax=Vreelandella sp. SM1641 TaxID=3126101 RepID=A0AAU7XS93_9GAMM|nr:hypothetical protein [Halomonas sp. KO116]AJY51407.1 hypothetical protein KO116_02934 [Halomonas sp. KO116]